MYITIYQALMLIAAGYFVGQVFPTRSPPAAKQVTWESVEECVLQEMKGRQIALLGTVRQACKVRISHEMELLGDEVVAPKPAGGKTNRD